MTTLIETVILAFTLATATVTIYEAESTGDTTAVCAEPGGHTNLPPPPEY